jgi:hypothetical protein
VDEAPRVLWIRRGGDVDDGAVEQVHALGGEHDEED